MDTVRCTCEFGRVAGSVVVCLLLTCFVLAVLFSAAVFTNNCEIFLLQLGTTFSVLLMPVVSLDKLGPIFAFAVFKNGLKKYCLHACEKKQLNVILNFLELSN